MLKTAKPRTFVPAKIHTITVFENNTVGNYGIYSVIRPYPFQNNLKNLDPSYKSSTVVGALVAQWVKRWPEFYPRSRRNPLNRKWSSIAHCLSLSTSHRPDMTETLLKRL